MLRIHLLYTIPAGEPETIARLEGLGYRVTGSLPNPDSLRALGQDPPSAVLIDLSRRPSGGRDAGLALRMRKTTRFLPLLYIGGDAEKVAAVRALLPDAIFTDWERLPADLLAAIRNPPTGVQVPDSVFAAYTDTPLSRKLGIKPGIRVALLEAPEGFTRSLGELPDGVTFLDHPGPDCDLTVWFVRSQAKLDAGLEPLKGQLGRSGLWIAWPKQGSGLESDLTQAAVRRAGLQAGLVDYKISSFDATWSGLKFSVRNK